MSHSPGHQKWPEHKVQEKPVRQRMLVEIGGEVLADSTSVIEVDEDDHEPCYYFPRDDIQMDMLASSSKKTSCPFKGEAHYFDFEGQATTLSDAAWSYQDPYDEHRNLKDRIAFHEEEPEIVVRKI